MFLDISDEHSTKGNLCPDSKSLFPIVIDFFSVKTNIESNSLLLFHIWKERKNVLVSKDISISVTFSGKVNYWGHPDCKSARGKQIAETTSPHFITAALFRT